MQLFLKLLIEKAISVDSDQTQEQSDLGLHCLHASILAVLVDKFLWHLLYSENGI